MQRKDRSPENRLPEEMRSENLYQACEVRAIERIVIEQYGIPGIALMRRAGQFAFQQIMAHHSRINHLVIVCGAGNNGGDGYVVARCARKIGIAVTVLAAAKPGTNEAATASQEYQDNGGVIVSVTSDMSSDMTSQAPQYHALLATADVMVDALFGIGLNRAPEGVGAELIRRMNDANCPIVSLDMPSGLHSDSGFAFIPCVRADTTITFIALKFGLLTGRGRSHAGRIIVANLNIPDEAQRTATPAARIISPPQLAKRDVEMHKGDAGNILVVGGDAGMFGAVLLAGEAALRCGSGLVTVASGAARLDFAALRCPELMSADALQLTHQDVSAHTDALVLGPGLGQSEWSEKVFQHFIAITNEIELPMVVDADAINLLARLNHQPADCRANWVLTPHPGEAARLLQCTVAEIQADRPAAAREIVAKFGGVCILKGAGTLVAHADRADRTDQADRANPAMWISDQGNPGMATAGMGDVLSGIIGALLGQGMPIITAATAGVWMHARAADTAVQHTGERGLLARDVIHHLAPVIQAMEAS